MLVLTLVGLGWLPDLQQQSAVWEWGWASANRQGFMHLIHPHGETQVRFKP